MARQELNLVGGFYKDPNLHWSAQDVLNWIPVPAEKIGTRTRFQFRDAPGFKPFVRITRRVPDGEGFITIDQGPVRGMRNVEGKLFVVSGTMLYQITLAGVAVPCGTVPGVGRVSMAHNERGSGNQLLIVNGSAGYVFDTSSLVFQKITDAGYPGAFIADFCDGYLTQVEPQGRYWLHSDLSQALDYNTFDQYEAEADPDRIVSLHVSFREVLIFGADTIEPFVNTGRAQGTFQRAANTVIQCGCSAKFSPRTMDNSVFFLDDQRIVRRMDGYNPVRVSTVGIESALAECSREEIASAFGVTFEDRGHKIYYLTVPGRFTFGYDVLSKEWHRRGSPGMGRWRLNDLVFWNGKWIGGDFQSGRLYELDWAYSLDSCDELERERVSGVLSSNQDPITVNEVELLFNVGGKVSTCVTFPAQPESPTLTAVLGDGVLGESWAGGTYVATGGTPPYSYTSRPGTTWPGNLGPMSSAGVVASEVPTATGSGVNVVRVTDSNQLYFELSDTFQITSSMVVAGAEISPAGPSAAYSGTAQSWTGVADAAMPLNAPAVAYGNGRWSCVINGDGWYSGNLVTWTQSASVATTGSGATAAAYGDGVFMVVGSSGLMYRSTDNAVNYSAVTDTGSNYVALAYGDGRWIAGVEGSSNGPYRTSIDGGLTWTQGSLVFPYIVGSALWNGEMWAIGGGTSNPIDPGGIKTSTDGVTWNTGIVTPGRVWALAYGNGIWVGLCQGGIIIYSDDDWETFSTSATTVSDVSRSTQICFNGLVFVICDNNGAQPAFTRTSVDGNTWTAPVTTNLADNQIIVSSYQYE